MNYIEKGYTWSWSHSIGLYSRVVTFAAPRARAISVNFIWFGKKLLLEEFPSSNVLYPSEIIDSKMLCFSILKERQNCVICTIQEFLVLRPSIQGVTLPTTRTLFPLSSILTMPLYILST